MISYADIKVGYECNNNCIHCAIANQRILAAKARGNDNRETAECLSEILSSKKNGYSAIVITGGEPTIRGDILQILAYAQTLGVSVAMQTNGRRLVDKEFAKLLASRVQYFTVALHGADAIIHDSVTRAAGSFSETISGLENLRSITSAICVKTVISKRNCRNLSDLVKAVHALGIKRHNIAFPHGVGNAATEYSNVVPFYSDIKDELEACIAFAGTHDLDLDFEAILPCLFRGKLDDRFFADLKQVQIQSIELKQLGAENIDWAQERKLSKLKDHICANCAYTSRCEGYWTEYVEARGFTEFAPIAG